jgi:hypothetical protein
MSTNNPLPKPSASSLLTALADVNGYVSLAVQLGELVVPIGKALVSKIASIGQGNATITFQLLVTQDEAELATVDQMSTDDLNAINAELVRLGKPALPAPPVSQ